MPKASVSTLQELIKNKFGNNRIFVLIWMVTVFFAALVELYNGIGIFKDLIYKGLPEKTKIYHSISTLKVQTLLQSFISVLGNPTYIKDFHLEESPFKEAVFVNKFSYIQAIVDKNNTVVAFSVTSRLKDFNPVFIPPGNSDAKIVLNKTSLYDATPTVDASYPTCYAYVGAQKFSYFEEFFGSNPQNYQTYLLGVNQSGYNDPDIISILAAEYSVFVEKNIGSKDVSNNCSRVPVDFRKKQVINTFFITSPAVNTNVLNDYYFGVDYNDVRIL